jgi:MFS family permease
MSDAPPASLPKLTRTQWLIVVIAAIGFAFDIYELLVWPLIGRPALERLLAVNQYTASGNQAILDWFSYIMYSSALCGGIFGLLGGYLTDRFGRRRVLTYSILLYALSALASGFATSPLMLLVLRCTTFIGVCVEFVAATAWLAELFTHPKQREAILGYTQAFSSLGGLMVTGAYWFCNHFSADLPAISGEHEAWRYTLISGVIPALPLIVIRPFLPESPAWMAKKQAGTLIRPRFRELFSPALRRVTIVSTILMMCAYGVAFGAIQLLPQIVPGLVPGSGKIVELRKKLDTALHDAPNAPETAKLKAQALQISKDTQAKVAQVQLWQELGGLIGRFALAYAAIVIISRRTLLRLFLIPGLVVTPIVFFVLAAGRAGPEWSLPLLEMGIFVVGFFTVAQFSFWGNYLPRVYPVRLRGTGESFAANVGGRMFGTGGNPLAILMVRPLIVASITGLTLPQQTAYAAGSVALVLYLLAALTTFFLPEPPAETEHLENATLPPADSGV